MFSAHQRTGLTGERWATSQLQSLGYSVKAMPDFFSDYDLLVDGVLPVEVKIALPTIHYGLTVRRYRWQWNIHGRMDADMLFIFIARDRCGDYFPYIVPSAELNNRRNVTITNHPNKYRGMWSANLGQWGWADYLLKRHYQYAGQLTLDYAL